MRLNATRLQSLRKTSAKAWKVFFALQTSLVLACITLAQSEGTRKQPILGQSPRYVNPLNLPANSTDGSAQGVSLGDPTVLRDGSLYYMFATGATNRFAPQGGAWVSTDLVHWSWKSLDEHSARVPVAPHVVKFNGMFYMAGNGSPLYRSANILGPYVEVGPWLDDQGRPFSQSPTPHGGTRSIFDVCIFVDKNDKPYVYMAYGMTYGVWGAPLDPNQLNHLAAPPTDLMKFNPNHVWERAGDSNERTYFDYIEGPWVFEHGGTYYLEYSASGTEWLTYSTGVYTAKKPLGPYTFMPGNPLLRQTHGVNTGPGHGSAVLGPEGNWWQFYLTVLPSPPGGRRIGMDPIGFERNGRMFIRGGVPSETPQWAPGVVADPVRDGDAGSIPLTFGKTRAMIVSSERPGHEAGYALDNFNGTWWEPADADMRPTLTVDLLAIPPFLPYTIDSTRIQFHAINVPLQGGNGRGRAAGPGATGVGLAPFGRGPAAPPPQDLVFSGSIAFRYKMEASVDGEQWVTVVDKTNNNVTRYTEFDDFHPALARFVRVTFTDWPRSVAQPLGIVEFTVFGKYIEQPLKSAKSQ